MFIRPHDTVTDEATWRAFVTDQGFGHLAVNSTDVPVVVPTQFSVIGDEVLLHLARANPVFEALSAVGSDPKAVLSVAGDWAYIPGGWRTAPDEPDSMGIPTTYYAAVQIRGTVTVIDDADALAEVLRRQIDDLEAPGALDDPTVHARRFPAIRGVRLSIDDVRAKFKYGANANDDQRQHIAAQLAERNGPGDLAARRHIPGLEA